MARVREIIGRTTMVASAFWTRLRGVSSVDSTITDYVFWDNFRRAKAKGFEMAGLFAQPIIEILAGWVIGAGFEAMLDEVPASEDDPVHYTNDLIGRFLGRVRSLLLMVVIDLYGLGDQYIIVNADGTLSIPSPETVDLETDMLDYRTPVSYTITTVLDKATVTDQYRLDGRTITIKWQDVSKDNESFEFNNLIGRIPVVHFANDRGSNEKHGRPIYERLYHIYSRYDSLIEKMVDGAQLMGNPIPTFEGMEDVDETIDMNSEPVEDWQDTDGSIRGRIRIAFDKMSAIFVGKGGSFKFSAPQVGFTQDMRNTLKSLFLLILETTRIPEVVWGVELSSSRASAGEQMKTFYAYIDGRRIALEGKGADDVLTYDAQGGLYALIDIWLRTKALTDRRVQVGAVSIRWPDLSEMDMQLTLNWAKMLHDKGAITDETLVRLSGQVEDPKAEVEAARAEVEAQSTRFESEEQEGIADDAPVMDELEDAAA